MLNSNNYSYNEADSTDISIGADIDNKSLQIDQLWLKAIRGESLNERSSQRVSKKHTKTRKQAKEAPESDSNSNDASTPKPPPTRKSGAKTKSAHRKLAPGQRRRPVNSNGLTTPFLRKEHFSEVSETDEEEYGTPTDN